MVFIVFYLLIYFYFHMFGALIKTCNPVACKLLIVHI